MKLAALVVLLVALLALPAFAYDWVTNPANGHRYTLVDCSSWTDAENQAVAMGGHLATVRSLAENNWIFQYAFDNKDTCYRLWLGITKPMGSSGPPPGYGWSWVSDEPVSFTYWVDWMDPTGWENNHGYMFVRFWDVRDEKITYWGPCDDESYPGNPTWTTGVIEVVPVPEPSSLLTLCGGVAGIIAFRRRRK